VAAWRGLEHFDGRAPVRAWLYRIATNRCLNALRDAGRRPRTALPEPPFAPPAPSRWEEPAWLEPYPDALLDGLPDRAPGPEARYETKEAVSLAFITALQLLPPRQRAVHVLRDVLGYHAREVADILGASEESVTSALKRARAALHARAPGALGLDQLPLATSASEAALAERFARAFEADDLDDLIALLTEDVRVSMPPMPFEWHGLDAVRPVLGAVLVPGRRLVATRANGQPAFGLYVPDPRAPVLHGVGLLVVTLAGDRVSAITRFDTVVFGCFGLPRTVTGSAPGPNRGDRPQA
jgi:RNA polymerase sigma-70 factor (ECF subfamily)